MLEKMHVKIRGKYKQRMVIIGHKTFIVSFQDFLTTKQFM